MSESMNDSEIVVDGSGDIFSDLGIVLGRDDELKIHIAREISRIIDRDGLTQVQVARLLKTDQAKVSNIARGNLKGFSVERLFTYLLELGFDIDVQVSRHSRSTSTCSNTHPVRGRVTMRSACG